MFYSDIALTKAHLSSRMKNTRRRRVEDIGPRGARRELGIFYKATTHQQAISAILHRCAIRGPASRINLYGCTLLSDAELARIVSLCSSRLTHLDLFDCSSLSSDAISLLREAELLEHISLRGLDQVCCRALCDWLGSSSICNLRYINLSGISSCSDEVLVTIAENRVSKFIQEIYVARTHVTDSGLLALLESCPQLTALDVAANLGVSDAVLDAVVVHGKALKWIDLRGTSVHDDTVAELVAILPELGVSWMRQGNVVIQWDRGIGSIFFVLFDMLGPSKDSSVGQQAGDMSSPLDLLFASVLENDPLARLQGEWHGLEDHKTYRVQGSTVHVSKDGVPLRTYDKLLQHKDGTIYWGSSGRYILDSNEDILPTRPPKQGLSSFCWERQSDSHSSQLAIKPENNREVNSGSTAMRFIKMNDLAEIEGRRKWYLLPSSRSNYVNVYIASPRKTPVWWKLPSSVTNYVRLASRQSKGSVFRTDKEILSKLRGDSSDENLDEHALKRVDNTWLEDNTEADADFSATENLHWDQFKLNEERFGVQTSFDWKLYTTDVPKNLTDTQRSKVEAIAREIEKEEALRGKNALKGTDDEEALYGAVIGTGRYTKGPEGGKGKKKKSRDEKVAVTETTRSSSGSEPLLSTEPILASLQGTYVDKKGKHYLIEGEDSFSMDSKSDAARGVAKPLVVELLSAGKSVSVKWGSSGLYSFAYPLTSDEVAEMEDGLPLIEEIVWKSRGGNVGGVWTRIEGENDGTVAEEEITWIAEAVSKPRVHFWKSITRRRMRSLPRNLEGPIRT
ncbi:Ataxin 2-like [Perkinsus chesapeaki]|uniref:Ataxin 2-like n=1 Tax=Perkinsus chesapeaki TaxID=330153 RepID=A0A7J6M2L8_PERCH|nr:Ataxin 2-like [Perkinsus chesapeaki]